MTVSMGLLLGGLGVWALRRKKGDTSQNVRLAALCPTIFFSATVSAQAFPGADTIETEFPDYWPKIGKFSYNEVPFAVSMLLLTAAGWRLAEKTSENPVHKTLKAAVRKGEQLAHA